MVPKGNRSKTTTNDAFDFNDDILFEDTIISGNMQEREQVDELESMDPFGTEGNMANEHATCIISTVDGLPSSLPKRKYTMTQRVRKEKRPRRIGSSRAKKVSLANVQQDLQSNICLKDCL